MSSPTTPPSESNDIKVAIVTGASSGIGQAVAIQFAIQGHRVVVVGRNEERLKNVVEEMVQHSPTKNRENFHPIIADFENRQQVDQVVETTLSKFKKIDWLINNAGSPCKRRTLQDPDFYEDFSNILQVNLMAPTRLAQLASPHILQTKGVIINVSSIADRWPISSISYSVAKAGLSMLTKTLANALDGTGVRVITVSPGPIITNFSTQTHHYGTLTNLQRVGEASEVADLISFLCSDKASFIHGTTIDIDGGLLSKYGNLGGQRRVSTEEKKH